MKVKLFQRGASSEESKLLNDLRLEPEIINIDTRKGKKQAEEWCVRNVPFLFFVSNDERKTYYSINTHKKLTKNDITSILSYCKGFGEEINT